MYNRAHHLSMGWQAASSTALSKALRASWLPKITSGWFFRAESFFTVARYLDEAAREPLSGPRPTFSRIRTARVCQVIMATHTPMLMAYPGARLLQLSKCGLETVRVEDTDHFKAMREFCTDPGAFVDAAITD